MIDYLRFAKAAHEAGEGMKTDTVAEITVAHLPNEYECSDCHATAGNMATARKLGAANATDRVFVEAEGKWKVDDCVEPPEGTYYLGNGLWEVCGNCGGLRWEEQQ